MRSFPVKRLCILLSIFLTGVLLAWEPFLILTLQTNIDDQVKYVMPHRALHFNPVAKVEAEQPFFVETAFISKEKTAQELSFSCTVTLTAPDGKKSVVGRKASAGSIPAGGQGVFMASFKVKIAFEKSDKTGVYSIELAADDNKGSVQKVTRKVELVESIVDNRAMDEKKFNDFMNFYYRDPQPGRIFAAWNYYLEHAVVRQQKKEGDNFNPAAGLLFFCEVLKANPQFQDEFAAMSNQAKAGDHAYYAFIYAGLGEEFLKKYTDSINPDVLTLVKRMEGQDPFEIGELTQPYQLDMLWTKFIAGGSFEPVQLLCRELRERPVLEIDAAKKIMKSGRQLSAKERELLMNKLMQIASFWSLQSNVKQGHHLLCFYLETILYKKLFADKQEAGMIFEILKNINSNKESGK